MSNYIDEKIIPLKLEYCGNEDMSLKEGYFIDGKLEIFIKASYFNDVISIYTPSSFIDMPKEIREIRNSWKTSNDAKANYWLLTSFKRK